ncbi:MAG: SRPBCC family protein [Acidobacteriota bacterium]
MAKFTLSKTLHHPLEDVFAVASDFPNAAGAIQAITKMEMLTEGEVGVGTRFRETRVMFGREATEEMEVTRFDPPRSYELFCESHGCRYVTTMAFSPEGDGTKIEMDFEATPLTFMAKVMSVVMKPMLNSCLKETAKDLDDIGRVLDEQIAGGSQQAETASAG